MKITIVQVLLILVILTTSGKPYPPDSLYNSDKKIGYGMEFDINNQYLWRGISYNKGIVVQPGAWISYNNFTIGLWGSLTSYDLHNSVKRNEVDLYITHNFNISGLDIENSVMYYLYPYQEDSPATAEYCLGISYPAGNFTLDSKFTIDILQYKEAYFVEHGITYDYKLADKLYLTSSLSMGWASAKYNENYVGISKPTLSILSTDLSLSYQPAVYFNIKPHIQLNRIIDKDLFELLDKYSVYYGIMLSSEF